MEGTVLSQRDDGGRVTARREVRTDATRRAGVGRIVVVDQFDIAGGRIAAINMAMDLFDGQTSTYRAFLDAQSGWLAPVDWRTPVSGGRRP